MRAQYKIFQRVIDDYISERFDCGHILFFYSEAFSLIANSRCGYEIDVYMLQICLCYAIVAWICRRQQRWTTATGKMKFNRKKGWISRVSFFSWLLRPSLSRSLPYLHKCTRLTQCTGNEVCEINMFFPEIILICKFAKSWEYVVSGGSASTVRPQHRITIVSLQHMQASQKIKKKRNTFERTERISHSLLGT